MVRVPWSGKSKVFEELPVHAHGVVLTRMNQEKIGSGLLQGHDDWSEFDNFWTRAENDRHDTIQFLSSKSLQSHDGLLLVKNSVRHGQTGGT